jgi:hypothetical protein
MNLMVKNEDGRPIMRLRDMDGACKVTWDRRGATFTDGEAKHLFGLLLKYLYGHEEYGLSATELDEWHKELNQRHKELNQRCLAACSEKMDAKFPGLREAVLDGRAGEFLLETVRGQAPAPKEEKYQPALF